jgi:hypothetical protein
MSYTVTKFVLDLPNLTASEKAVANVLAYHAHPDGTNAFPSMSTIAAKAGLKHRQSAQRVMKRLEEKNIIVAETHTRGGTGKTTRYSFVMENCSSVLQLDSSNCSPGSSNCSPESMYLQPGSCTKGKERSVKSNNGANAPLPERDHCYHLPGCDCVSPSEEFEWIVNRQLDEEDEIIASLAQSLTAWVANLKLLSLPRVPLAEADAVAAFTVVNDLLLCGAAWTSKPARGSFWSLLDYERIWALEETFGVGTCKALAEKVEDLVKHDDLHRVTIQSFAWNHLADQLIERKP